MDRRNAGFGRTAQLLVGRRRTKRIATRKRRARRELVPNALLAVGWRSRFLDL